MLNKMYRIIVRKLFETGILRIDFRSEERAEEFFKWLYPNESEDNKDN